MYSLINKQILHTCIDLLYLILFDYLLLFYCYSNLIKIDLSRYLMSFKYRQYKNNVKNVLTSLSYA